MGNLTIRSPDDQQERLETLAQARDISPKAGRETLHRLNVMSTHSSFQSNGC
jgi:hypothetical protein